MGFKNSEEISSSFYAEILLARTKQKQHDVLWLCVFDGRSLTRVQWLRWVRICRVRTTQLAQSLWYIDNQSRLIVSPFTTSGRTSQVQRQLALHVSVCHGSLTFGLDSLAVAYSGGRGAVPRLSQPQFCDVFLQFTNFSRTLNFLHSLSNKLQPMGKSFRAHRGFCP